MWQRLSALRQIFACALIIVTMLVAAAMYRSQQPLRSLAIRGQPLNDVIVTFIPAPAGGRFLDPVWLPSGEIVAVWGPTSGAEAVWQSQLYSLQPDGSNFARLPIPDDPECRWTSHHFPKILPDGRIGFVQGCWLSQTRDMFDEHATLMAYDPVTQVTERLVPYYLPASASFFDFAPDMRVGIINDGAGLYDRLYWLYPDRMEPLNLPLARAGSPSWSPDGQRIAVTGVPNDFGRTGPSRAVLPRVLYFLSGDGMRLDPILDRIVASGRPAWSPAGEWLMDRLYFADGAKGIWLIEVATGSQHLLMPGESVGSGSWSPDGRAVVVSIGGDYLGEEGAGSDVGLYVITLPDIPGPARGSSS